MMNRRRLLVLGLGGATTGMLPGALQAKETDPAQERPFRVLMFTFRGQTDVERGFQDYLASRNVKAEFRILDVSGDVSKVGSLLATSLPDFRPDLIYTNGTPLTLAVAGPYDAPANAGFIRDIPVVFALVAAPVQVKIVPSLASSERNVTGAVHIVPTDVQLRAMQNYRPFDNVGVLYSANERNAVAIVDEVKSFCANSGARMTARPLPFTGAKADPDAVAALVRDIRQAGAQWLYLPPDSALATVFQRVAEEAIRENLPTFGSTEFFLRAGPGLVGLVSRYYSVGQLAGSKAVDILTQGANPQTLPIEKLKRFSLIINMKVAKQIGAYPPISMLNYADIIT